MLIRAAAASVPSWTRWNWRAAGASIGIALAIRLYLLPDVGFSDDLGEFARLGANIAEKGLGRAYEGLMSFGPVVAYLWWLMTLVEPAFRGAVDSSDVGVRMLLKLPPLLADFGLAALVAFALRARPRWAVAGAAIVLLHPVVWFVSSWWGQYESVFVLFLLVAFLFAIRDQPLLGAIAFTAALMTKPQALPFALPFAAWYLARYDPVTIVRSAMSAAVAAIVLWLPFVPWDGPSRYLALLDWFQNSRFDILSLRAWNLWWVVQRDVLHVAWQPDGVAAVGPLTYRTIAYAITGSLALVVAYRVWRRPTPAVFALALAATSLIAFAFLTQMHDRYAYAALIFLALLPDRRLVLGFSAIVGTFVLWNLLASASAARLLHVQVELSGLPGVIGSAAFCLFALAAIGLTWREPADAASALADSNPVEDLDPTAAPAGGVAPEPAS